MVDNPPGIWKLVWIPALISLVVTVVRLLGELNGWNATLFGNAGPGGRQGLFGISWLIPLFGLWFGWRLRALHGEPAHAGKAALRLAIGAVVLIGGIFAASAAGLVAMANEEAPVEAKGFGTMLGVLAVAGVVMFSAWPRLGLTLIVYAILARIPVVVVTWLALERGWDTHYTKLPAGLLRPEGISEFWFLTMPQVTFWIVATLMVGGLCGCLGAALRRRAR